MVNLTNLLSGVKLLEQVDSPFNGKLVVKKDLVWGIYIQAEGLTQSGGIVEKIWNSVLKNVPGSLVVRNALILGLGGGTVAKLIRNKWPQAKIVGIDIDPTIINLGRRHLNLNKTGVEIKIRDVGEYLKTLKLRNQGKEFDLIINDLYQGDKFPGQFETENYIHLVGCHLERSGVVIFNRLYGSREQRGASVRFLKKLEKEFKNVIPVYPEANVMYICQYG